MGMFVISEMTVLERTVGKGKGREREKEGNRLLGEREERSMQ